MIQDIVTLIYSGPLTGVGRHNISVDNKKKNSTSVNAVDFDHLVLVKIYSYDYQDKKIAFGHKQ